jgi:hypothetical protein
MSDILSAFIEQSHAEKGEHVTRRMKKEVDGAGFCIKARAGNKAIDQLFADLDKIDLSKHQLAEDAK